MDFTTGILVVRKRGTEMGKATKNRGQVIKFGQYAGNRWSDVPEDYLSWAAGQDGWLQSGARRELTRRADALLTSKKRARKTRKPRKERTQPCHSEKAARDKATHTAVSEYHTRLPMPQYQHLQPGSTETVPSWDQQPPFDTGDEVTAEYLSIIRGEQ